jgi:hypothetical protein
MSSLRKKLKELVCQYYCPFFKPKEDVTLACQGILFLERGLESGLLSWQLVTSLSSRPVPNEYPFDAILEKELCSYCPFLPDGCDFRDQKIRCPTSPCGAYLFLQNLLTMGLLDPALFTLIHAPRVMRP